MLSMRLERKILMTLRKKKYDKYEQLVFKSEIFVTHWYVKEEHELSTLGQY
jgi:hypothetical protein